MSSCDEAKPDWTICIPCLTERAALWPDLFANLSRQIDQVGGGVEVLCYLDAGVMHVNHKRNAMLTAARGRYISFVDDDDVLTHRYVPAILEAIREGDPDVVTFEGVRSANGGWAERMVWGEGRRTNTRDADGTRRIAANHLCAVRADIARACWFFGETMYQNAWSYTAMLHGCGRMRRETHLAERLYHYRFSSTGTRCQTPKALEAFGSGPHRYTLLESVGGNGAPEAGELLLIDDAGDEQVVGVIDRHGRRQIVERTTVRTLARFEIGAGGAIWH